jgi:hypothetical protein
MSVNAKPIDTTGHAKSGLQVAKTKLKLKGLVCIDRRTLNAQRLPGFKASLAAALRGSENLSPQLECLIELIEWTEALTDHADSFLLSQPRLTAQQSGFVEMAVRTRLYIDHLNLYLLEQVSLVNRKKRAVLSVVRERQILVDWQPGTGGYGLTALPTTIRRDPQPSTSCAGQGTTHSKRWESWAFSAAKPSKIPRGSIEYERQGEGKQKRASQYEANGS